MKKTFLLLMLLATATMTFAQEKYIKVIEPVLYRPFSALLGSDRYKIDSLVVRYGGVYLSAGDIALIANCCKYGRLTGVDLSCCSFIQDNCIPAYLFAPDVINAKPRTTEATGDDELDSSLYTNLRYITLPGSLKKIDVSAFAYTNLEAVSIPYKVAEIGDGAFFGCKNLKNIVLHGPVARADAVINGFRGVPSDAVLSVAPGLGDYYRGLDACSGLVVRESECAYRTMAFALDGSRTLAETLGDYDMNVDSLTLSGPLAEDDLFLLSDNASYGNLTGLNLTDCVISDGYIASCRMRSLRMPRRMERIPGAFLNRTKVEYLTMPESYGEIFSMAFEYAGYFADSTLVIPDGCRRIGYCAFRYCVNIKKLVLPATLEVLEASSLAFNATDPMIHDVELYVNRMYPPESSTTCEEFEGLTGETQGPFGCTLDADHPNCKTKGWTLYVPMGAKKNYENAEHWSHFETIIETPLLTGTSTGISAITERTVPADGIYTVDGRLVRKDTSTEGLAKGLYIVMKNGTARKVVTGR